MYNLRFICAVLPFCENANEAEKSSYFNRLYSGIVCIRMGIKILQQAEARRKSIAISYANDEERRLAVKDYSTPYKVF